MPKINHDQLFKELLTTFFIEFIELFFPEVLEYLDINSITFVDKRCDPAPPSGARGRAPRRTKGTNHANYY